jgi:hypothetical protein
MTYPDMYHITILPPFIQGDSSVLARHPATSGTFQVWFWSTVGFPLFTWFVWRKRQLKPKKNRNE